VAYVHKSAKSAEVPPAIANANCEKKYIAIAKLQ
jgi:hypothetical protein